MGSIRYGTRGSISPPPPGSGPCYRTQWCRSNAQNGIPAHVPWISPLATPSINSFDIISCANRANMSEKSELSQQASVRDHLRIPNKFLLNARCRRCCAFVRNQICDRLCKFEDETYEEDDILNNLDRLPRFRFGGNRTSSTSKRDFEKTSNEQRLKDFADRLKRGPVPPPRTKRATPPPPKPSQETKIEDNIYTRPTPHRSASLSQVDYLSDGRKYIRKFVDLDQQLDLASSNIYNRGITTLPRSKTSYYRNTQPSFASRDREEINNFQKEETNRQSPERQQSFNIPGPTRPSTSNADEKRSKLKRRKGIYIKFDPPLDNTIPPFIQDGDFQSNSTKGSQDFLPDIPTLLTTEPSDYGSWTSPQEEPLSPEENTSPPEWSTHYKLHNRTPSLVASLNRFDSFSEDDPDSKSVISQTHSDISDYETRRNSSADSNTPRTYNKRPLRGPYGQMLEAEMKKPETSMRNQMSYDLNFLNDLPASTASRSGSMKLAKDMAPKHSKDSSSRSYDDSHSKKKSFSHLLNPPRTNVPKRKVSADNFVQPNQGQQCVNHQRTTSSPSKLGLINTEVSNVLLEQLLQGSSEQFAILDNKTNNMLNDTRTHVVVELYDNERIYVESLQVLMTKYLEPLKSPEYATLLNSTLVDEIFDQIPFLLSQHQNFLEELKKRLDQWDIKQRIGDVLVEMFSKSTLIDSYTSYVNNWKRARDIIKTTQQTKPHFAKFLESTAREHKGKLALDSLLIKPIQKFPKYELLLQRLIKHTDENHPDQSLLLSAQKELHEQILKINCTERESVEHEQLREIEGLIEGLANLVTTDRQYLRHDLVTISAGSGPKKERALFLFSDILVMTSIKRKSGTIRKPVPIVDKGSVTSALEANKYKLLMKISLDDLEIVKPKDENVQKMMTEIENLNEDLGIINQISELSGNLHCNHSQLDDIIRDLFSNINKQLSEQQTADSQLSYLDLNFNTSNGPENICILFSTPEKRASWEESFVETKNKLVAAGIKKAALELLATVPIRKTRAGLQFTCAAPISADNPKDVWVCNSDGYVGQVCVLSLHPEPEVISCNGVCNARILCIASVPAATTSSPAITKTFRRRQIEPQKTIQFDSSSSSDDDKSENDDHEGTHHTSDRTDPSSSEFDEYDHSQSTMWLGTEDGCIHIYNSNDNIRIKKNKIKIQHNSPVLCVIYFQNRVFISLANGDIIVYDRDSAGGWNMASPMTITVGSTSMPILKIISKDGKLWCACGHYVKILNAQSLITEKSFCANHDSNKPISCMVLSGNNVWLSLLNGAVIKCFNATTFEFVFEINVATSVTKMLTSCDDIIRQHKAACLRVTSLLACKDLLWIGTSAGVLLTMALPPSTSPSNPTLPSLVTGISHGHTGHVRFLTSIEIPAKNNEKQPSANLYKRLSSKRNEKKYLIISGGDGYEDFRSSTVSEVAGREDSTNHLLLWNV